MCSQQAHVTDSLTTVPGSRVRPVDPRVITAQRRGRGSSGGWGGQRVRKGFGEGLRLGYHGGRNCVPPQTLYSSPAPPNPPPSNMPFFGDRPFAEEPGLHWALGPTSSDRVCAAERREVGVPKPRETGERLELDTVRARNPAPTTEAASSQRYSAWSLHEHRYHVQPMTGKTADSESRSLSVGPAE